MSCASVLVACAAVCGCDAPAKPGPEAAPTSAAPAKTEPAKAKPAKAEPAKADPVLLEVCKAYDDVVARSKAEQAPISLTRVALRATERGVGEAQLEALGATPPKLLASIRARGNPPECTALVGYLEALPP